MALVPYIVYPQATLILAFPARRGRDKVAVTEKGRLKTYFELFRRPSIYISNPI
ncbi:hypothetical protein NEISICOT_03001 [Neisseria sicca ATCC 29256]|uniref:Uncharacterized protein n=1 Tax=Neisseria sicca ATCC 29256 TaxID=547045 RepID=C6M8X6_NEISI|nr:hypothetical protein [Neisseria sicca]EET43206.1 hypothetical protein NEISICOT_03001 [Neisseria sicca ATCC 29256]